MFSAELRLPPCFRRSSCSSSAARFNILQPTIIGKAAQVSGFTVLTSVLAFGALFGLIGAIIGVPIAAALQIVAEELTAGRRARIAAEDAANKLPT